ncbi:translocation/assembly module TamB domain-containing protein [Reichenbachiella versicolor]|uniref:translocation/assembly module TamB domain-containing protein n=1 Tax=Reichenbachiella versicolor TaxID=1821036 RepID=UPI000D6E672D|nr:translocation/assembly module TamB domain-containing protein [Reichenbachiella versicolor]
MNKKAKVESLVLLRKSPKIFIWTLAILAVFFIAFISAFQIPRFQTELVNKVSELISSKTSFAITVGKANLTWYDQMELNDIRIFEKSNDSTLIQVDDLSLDVNLIHFLFTQEIKGRRLTLEKPQIHIIKSSDSLEINLTRFLNELKLAFKKDENQKKTSLNISSTFISNGVFSYNDVTRPREYDFKDINHITYNQLNGKLSELIYLNDKIDVKIDSLTAIDPDYCFDIKSFQSHLLFNKQSLSLNRLSLNIGSSLVRDSITFLYSTPSQFKYLFDSIYLHANLKNTIIHTRDIQKFIPNYPVTNQTINLSGKYIGTINDLELKSAEIQIGRLSKFRTSGIVVGLPSIKETFFDLKFQNSSFSHIDFSQYLPYNFIERITPLGKTYFSGSFTGYLNDFVTKTKINSEIGTADIGVSINIREETKAFYRGRISLDNFELSKFLTQESNGIEKITLDGTIKGNGLEVETAIFDLDALAKSAHIKGYPYKNIRTKAHFEAGIFAGEIAINDTNLQLAGLMDINLKEEIKKIDLAIKIDTINIEPLNLSSVPFSFSSQINAKLSGSHFEDLRGYLNLKNFYIGHQNQILKVDSLKLISSLSKEMRIIELKTNNLSASLKGHYTNNKLIKAINHLHQDISTHLKNNGAEKKDYYLNKSLIKVDNIDANLLISASNLNEYIQPFFPKISFSKNINISGQFSQDSTVNLSLFTEFDSSSLGKSQFIENELDIQLTKSFYNSDIIASIYTSSFNQTYEKINSKNLKHELLWFNDEIEYYGTINQQGQENGAEIIARAFFKTDTTVIKFIPSNIRILGEKWNWTKNHEINIINDQILFKNFGVSSNDQKFKINGIYSIYNTLNVKVTNLDLSLLNTITQTKIEGILDGDFIINQEEEHHLVNGKFITTDIKVDDFLVGNLFSSSKWEPNEKRLNIKSYLVRDDDEKMDILGHYYPSMQEFGNLEFKAKFHDMHIKTLEPFINQFSNLGGTVKGDFSLSGTLAKPIIEGQGKVSNGKCKVDYLNTNYGFEGSLNFTKTSIYMDGFSIKDREQNQAFLSGNIYHEGFKKYELDLFGEFTNFNLLNTTSVDNDLYYGFAYGSGNVQFTGALENLNIKAEAKTTKGTRLSIPLDWNSSTGGEQKEYIEFGTIEQDLKQDSIQTTSTRERVKIKGIVFDFNIEVTPDAYLELIFDAKSGDIIRGRGNGNMNLVVDTQGEFNMFGDYQIEEGGYNFTLYNIINKEFIINKGGSIAWYGDPYGAQININARYRQLASVAPLLNLSEEDVASPESRRKYPSYVDLFLTGDLLEPKIQFDIEIEDYPRTISIVSDPAYPLDTYINSFKTKIRNNEQEMNRQVFSLIILRKFSPENTFDVSSTTIGSSFSEFISNQLSYWVSQVDENLEVDVDLASLSEDAFNTFQLRLSYTFFDGRLRVTRDGSINTDKNQDTQSNNNSYIGDWTVEYMLTSDGRFRAKVYSRNDLNAIETQPNDTNYETGFSLQFVRSFDELKHILHDKRKEELKNQNI